VSSLNYDQLINELVAHNAYHEHFRTILRILILNPNVEMYGVSVDFVIWICRTVEVFYKMVEYKLKELAKNNNDLSSIASLLSLINRSYYPLIIRTRLFGYHQIRIRLIFKMLELGGKLVECLPEQARQAFTPM
jgi:hypothetical protein